MTRLVDMEKEGLSQAHGQRVDAHWNYTHTANFLTHP